MACEWLFDDESSLHLQETPGENYGRIRALEVCLRVAICVTRSHARSTRAIFLPVDNLAVASSSRRSWRSEHCGAYGATPLRHALSLYCGFNTKKKKLKKNGTFEGPDGTFLKDDFHQTFPYGGFILGASLQQTTERTDGAHGPIRRNSVHVCFSSILFTYKRRMVWTIFLAHQLYVSMASISRDAHGKNPDLCARSVFHDSALKKNVDLDPLSLPCFMAFPCGPIQGSLVLINGINIIALSRTDPVPVCSFENN